MTIRHAIDYYMDGHSMIAFCKVCSAEGDKLIDDCPGKYENKLDDKKPKPITSVIENKRNNPQFK